MFRFRWRAVVVSVVLAGSACSSSTADPPALGAGMGPVTIAPLALPAAGSVLPVRITSSLGERTIGGACTSLEQWDDGDWELRWNLTDAPAAPVAIEEGGGVTCNAMGFTFPAEFELTLPVDLDAGTWRLVYHWTTPGDEATGTASTSDTATYVFEVGS